MRSRLSVLGFALALTACGTELDPALLDSIEQGRLALEANHPADAKAHFDAYLEVDPLSCGARYGGFLAAVQQMVQHVHAFNKGIFDVQAEEFAEYEDLEPSTSLSSQSPAFEPLAADRDIVGMLLVQGLLQPLYDDLNAARAYAEPITNSDCSFEVDLPIRFILGTGYRFDLTLGRNFGPTELSFLLLSLETLQGGNQMLLGLNLELNAVSILRAYNRMKDKPLVGALRALAPLAQENPEFMNFNPDPERARLFADAEQRFAFGIDNGLVVARTARAQLDELTLVNPQSVIHISDSDESGTMTPGDKVVLNFRGSYKRLQNTPKEFEDIRLDISAFLDPRPLYPDQPTSAPGIRLLDSTIEFLADTAHIYRLERPVGSRIKLEKLNGLAQAFGQRRILEDVLEWDPNAFFRGPIHNPVSSRAYPPGVTEGLQSLLIVGGEGYPEPPQPKPLREMLPWWYRPAHAPDEYYFAVEGEKSFYYVSESRLPAYLSYGDFDHFLFDAIDEGDARGQGGAGVADLHIARDCLEPPDDDALGINTTVYAAMRDPTLGSSLYGNIDILSGGECPDDTDYNVVWNPVTHYTFNKILAHLSLRLARYLIDLSTLL